MTKSTSHTKNLNKAPADEKVKTVAKQASAQKKAAPISKPSVSKPSAPKPPVSKVTAKSTHTAKARAVSAKPSTQKKSISAKAVATPKTKIINKAPMAAKTKTAVKKSTVKTAAAKKAAPSKTITTKTMTKSTKEDLRKTISSLESRMKRADTLTRKSVKALESAVMTLDARTRKDNSASKAVLTRKVNALSAKLTSMVEQTQSDVTSELKTALNNPSSDNLQNALHRAEDRMSRAEQVQAAAISKVNRHLASIANAVDKRIENESRAREDAIASVRSDAQDTRTALTTRLETIETDTAQALSRVGDKITELSGELTQRGEVSELSIREKVSEIALQTQTELENYRTKIERRIDNVADQTNTQDTQRLEHMIAGLTARLEGLEHAVANAPVPAPVSVPVSAPVAPIILGLQDNVAQQAAPSAPQLSVVPSQSLTAGAPASIDAFTPLTTIPSAQANAMPNPYLVAEPEVVEAPAPKPQEHIPVEFNPGNYGTQLEQPAPVNMPDIKMPDISPMAETPVQSFTDAPVMPPPLSPLTDITPLPPMVEADQTIPFAADPAYPNPAYADPAYAESDPTMDKVRINNESPSKFNLPKLSGRTLRVAALATGVAVVGLIAAKGVFGGDPASGPNTQQIAQNTQTPQTAPAPSVTQTDTSVAPIGNYADNKIVQLISGSEASESLNSAAAAGDAIAQFQLGLSYLEQGRAGEGVALIRKSANQNQPAAQYRLAKLYESGEGVGQDVEIARQLTERAARNGNRIAMHDLALYYAEGRGGVEPNLPIAAKWFEKAAERGVVDSQFNLGVLFESGQGLPKNVNDAFVWYSIAAAQGDQFAKTRVDVLKDTLDQADLVKTASRVKNFKPRKIDDAANGIFRNVAWGKSAKDTGQQISQIKQVQTLLSDLGYDIGGADGSMGPKTRAAIMNFERSNSLPETGRVNTALLDRLELAAGA